MTIAYWCVLIAALLPYAFTGYAKSGGGYDNRAPREWLDRREGAAKRAHWAQLNSFEAFPPFAAAVIIAHATGGAAQATIDALAVAFVVLRALYGVVYVADRPTLRTSIWTLGLLCVIGLFVAAA